jgi:hypothetical protein
VLGVSTTATFDANGNGSVFSFQASPGQLLLYDALDPESGAASVRLRNPEDVPSPVQGGAFGDIGPFLIDREGLFSLVFNAPAGGVASLRFRLLTLAAATPVASNVDTKGVLNPPREANLYRLTAAAGQRLRLLTAAVGSGRAAWSLFSPSGVRLAEAELGIDPGEQRLLWSGTYYLVVRPVVAPGNLDRALEFTLHPQLLSDAPLAYHSAALYTGSFGGSGTFSYPITAPAGLLFVLDSQLPGGVLKVSLSSTNQTLWDGLPAGTDLGTPADSVLIRPYIMPVSGSYTLRVTAPVGSTGGSFRLRPLPVSTASPTLALGTEQSGLIEAFGLRTFRFVGAPGQRLYYDALLGASEAGPTTCWLVAPSGAVVLGNVQGQPQSASTDAGPATLVEEGNYYLMVSNGGSGTANYRFRLLDAAGVNGALLRLGEVVGSAGPVAPELAAYSAALFRFGGGVGQAVFLDSLNARALGATWALVEADGTAQPTAPLVNDVLTRLRTVGTRVLVLGNDSGFPVPYGFRAIEPMVTTEPMPGTGTTVAGNLATPGAEARFTFLAAAGELFYYDGVAAGQAAIRSRVERPSGDVLAGPVGADGDLGPVAALEAGQHTLVVQNASDVAGTFQFRFLRTSGAQVLVPGVSVEGSLAGMQAMLYSFAAAATRPTLIGALGGPVNAVWGWYDGAGIRIAGELPTTADLGPSQPAAGGTQVLVLRNLGPEQAAYRFVMNAENRAPVLGDASPEVVEETTLRFQVPGSDPDAGDRLTYALDPGAPLGLTLDAGSGLVLWTPTEADGPGVYDIGVAVRDSGQPPLSVRRSYRIRVLEANRPPVLAAISDQSVVAGQALQLKLTATDPDLPTQPLSYAVVSGPAGLTVDSTSGVLRYLSSVAAGAAVYDAVVAVRDSGTLALEARRSFKLSVSRLERPALTLDLSGRSATLRWNSAVGIRYRVQYCPSSLNSAWVDLGADLVARRTSMTLTDTLPDTATGRFYRVLAVD